MLGAQRLPAGRLTASRPLPVPAAGGRAPARVREGAARTGLVVLASASALQETDDSQPSSSLQLEEDVQESPSVYKVSWDEFKNYPTKKMCLMGKFGRDIEIYEYTKSRVGRTSIAVKRRAQDGFTILDDDVDWYNVSIWGDLASHAAAEFRKGSFVAISGRLEVEEYNGKVKAVIHAETLAHVDKQADLQSEDAQFES